MPNESLVNLALMASYLASVGFASLFGTWVERTGAAILAAGLVGTWTAQALVHDTPLIFAAIDFVGAAAFAWLALRSPEKLWPGLAGCAQLLVAVFSATRALDFPLSHDAYVFMVNLSSAGIVLALLGGTIVTRWFPRPPTPWDLAYEATAPKTHKEQPC